MWKFVKYFCFSNDGFVGATKGVLFLVALIHLSQALEEGDPCEFGPNTGRCEPYSECKTLGEAISKGLLRSQRDIKSCGFNVYEEIICCPILELKPATTPIPEEPLPPQEPPVVDNSNSGDGNAKTFRTFSSGNDDSVLGLGDPSSWINSYIEKSQESMEKTEETHGSGQFFNPNIENIPSSNSKKSSWTGKTDHILMETPYPGGVNYHVIEVTGYPVSVDTGEQNSFDRRNLDKTGFNEEQKPLERRVPNSWNSPQGKPLGWSIPGSWKSPEPEKPTFSWNKPKVEVNTFGKKTAGSGEKSSVQWIDTNEEISPSVKSIPNPWLRPASVESSEAGRHISGSDSNQNLESWNRPNAGKHNPGRKLDSTWNSGLQMEFSTTTTEQSPAEKKPLLRKLNPGAFHKAFLEKTEGFSETKCRGAGDCSLEGKRPETIFPGSQTHENLQNPTNGENFPEDRNPGSVSGSAFNSGSMVEVLESSKTLEAKQNSGFMFGSTFQNEEKLSGGTSQGSSFNHNIPFPPVPVPTVEENVSIYPRPGERRDSVFLEAIQAVWTTPNIEPNQSPKTIQGSLLNSQEEVSSNKGIILEEENPENPSVIGKPWGPSLTAEYDPKTNDLKIKLHDPIAFVNQNLRKLGLDMVKASIVQYATINQNVVMPEKIIQKTTEKTVETTTRVPEPPALRPAAKVCESFSYLYPPSLTPHILGGIPADEGEFPHMAALGYVSTGVGDYDFQCGGSLIDSRFVLTAAHCVYNPYNPPAIVRLGTINLKDSAAIDVEVDQIHIHPDYRSSSKYHDIAILELKRPVEFTDLVKPACLVTDFNQLHLKNSHRFQVTGWGTVNTLTKRKSDILLKAELNMVPLSRCNEFYRNDAGTRALRDGIITSQICAVDALNFKDACQGDSGGPLNLSHEDNYVIAGIVSTGLSCGTSVPGLYTNVTSYLDFIEEICWSSLK